MLRWQNIFYFLFTLVLISCSSSSDRSSGGLAGESRFSARPVDRAGDFEEEVAQFDESSEEASEPLEATEQFEEAGSIVESQSESEPIVLRIERRAVDFRQAGESVLVGLPSDFICEEDLSSEAAWSAIEPINFQYESVSEMASQCQVQIRVPADDGFLPEVLGSLRFQGVVRDHRRDEALVDLDYQLEIRLAQSVSSNLAPAVREDSSTQSEGVEEVSGASEAAVNFKTVVDSEQKIKLGRISAFRRTESTASLPENILLLPKDVSTESEEKIIFNYTLPPVDSGSYRPDSLEVIQCLVSQYSSPNVFGEPDVHTRLPLSLEEALDLEDLSLSDLSELTAVSSQGPVFCPFRLIDLDPDRGVFQLELRTRPIQMADGTTRYSLDGISSFDFLPGKIQLVFEFGVSTTRNDNQGQHLVRLELALELYDQPDIKLANYTYVGEFQTCSYFVSDGAVSLHTRHCATTECSTQFNPYILNEIQRAETIAGRGFKARSLTLASEEEKEAVESMLVQELRRDRSYWINAFNFDLDDEWESIDDERASVPQFSSLLFEEWRWDQRGRDYRPRSNRTCGYVLNKEKPNRYDRPMYHTACRSRLWHVLEVCPAGGFVPNGGNGSGSTGEIDPD